MNIFATNQIEKNATSPSFAASRTSGLFVYAVSPETSAPVSSDASLGDL